MYELFIFMFFFSIISCLYEPTCQKQQQHILTSFKQKKTLLLILLNFIEGVPLLARPDHYGGG